MPVVATPNIWPLSSNDTSAVGGSTESTRLTSLLPFVSLICSPSIKLPLLSHCFELTSGEWQIVRSSRTSGLIFIAASIPPSSQPQPLRVKNKNGGTHDP